MSKKTHFLLFLVLAIVLCNCKPDEPETPDNPLNGKTTAVFNPTKKYGTVTDIDGNVYKTIVIGKQTWMAENLRVTRYQNGDIIANVTDNNQWATIPSGAYCTYNNTTNADTIATYGFLYNWHAAGDGRNLAPKGWRVPNIADWDILIEYLGGDTIASNKLKEAGNKHWEDPYKSDNSSGFTALPGGWRDTNEKTTDLGYFGFWWTSYEYNSTKAGRLFIFYFDSKVWRGLNIKTNGYAIRCIKE